MALDGGLEEDEMYLLVSDSFNRAVRDSGAACSFVRMLFDQLSIP